MVWLQPGTCVGRAAQSHTTRASRKAAGQQECTSSQTMTGAHREGTWRRQAAAVGCGPPLLCVHEGHMPSPPPDVRAPPAAVRSGRVFMCTAGQPPALLPTAGRHWHAGPACAAPTWQPVPPTDRTSTKLEGGADVVWRGSAPAPPGAPLTLSFIVVASIMLPSWCIILRSPTARHWRGGLRLLIACSGECSHRGGLAGLSESGENRPYLCVERRRAPCILLLRARYRACLQSRE
jgi:hypothetical protein